MLKNKCSNVERVTIMTLQVSGTFLCMDCQAVVKDVPQQFKYSPPTICRNPVCNNRARFHLDTHKSKFIDFQKVTVCVREDVCVPTREWGNWCADDSLIPEVF